MSDNEGRFASLDLLEPPEQWSEIEQRRPGGQLPPTPEHRARKILSASLVALLVLAAFVWAVSGLRRGLAPSSPARGDSLFLQTQASLREEGVFVTRIDEGSFTPRVSEGQASGGDPRGTTQTEAVLVWVTTRGGDHNRINGNGPLVHHPAWLFITPNQVFPFMPNAPHTQSHATGATFVDATSGRQIGEISTGPSSPMHFACPRGGEGSLGPVLMWSDGVHVDVGEVGHNTFFYLRDPSDQLRSYGFDLSGLTTDGVLPVPPGTWIAGCFSGQFDTRDVPLSAYSAPFEIVDPNGYWPGIKGAHTGSGSAVVPDVLGLDMKSARHVLRGAGLTPVWSVVTGGYTRGGVIEQRPVAGSVVAAGTKIAVTLGPTPSP